MQPLDPNTANFVAERGDEKAFAWLNADGSANFGTMAANGGTNFLTGNTASAVQFAGNLEAQGYRVVRFDERWNAARTERGAGGLRRRQSLITVADQEHNPAKTFAIFPQGEQYLCLTIENDEPSTFIGTFPQAVTNLFETLKPGWVITRVSAELSGLLVTPAE